jgi:hypothetical protein
MTASDCNVETFLLSLNGKDLLDLIYAAEQEAVSAERSLYRRTADPERREKCGREYAGMLKHFICFVRYGCKPRGIDPDVFDLFREIKDGATHHPIPLTDRAKIQCEFEAPMPA